MRFLIHRYCNHQTLWVVASTTLVMTLAAGAMMFATSGPRGTVFGVHLGADYGAFYTIGLLQNRYGTERLYDLRLQNEILHEAVVGVLETASLPFAYPPFVAPLFRLFALLPYAWSFAAWLVASAVLYTTAVGLTLRVCPAIPTKDRVSIWLLALSFNPFTLEAWLGGQTSCFGVVSVAAAIACHRLGRSYWAGAALSLLLYKPTLTGLILVMLVAGRRWGTLIGFAAGGCVLAVVSAAIVGVDGSFAYADFLLSYGRLLEVYPETFKEGKFIDFTASLTLLGLERKTARILAILIALPIAGLLALAWHRSRCSLVSSDLAWAATFCFLPIVNNYGPIYDAALVVPGLILGADAIRRRHPRAWPVGFSAVITGVYLGGLLSSVLAMGIGVQVITPALMAMGLYMLQQSFTANAYEVIGQ